MVDISLDLDPEDAGTSAYKDLLVVDNDLCLTADANSVGTNPILQDILQSIAFFLSEWFLDNTQGVPYYQQVMIKNPVQSKIDAIFQNVILGRPGVTSLPQYSFSPNMQNRVLTLSFRALTTSGVVSYSGTINPVTPPGGS